METAITDFLNRCLIFDIEVNEKKVVYSLGAVLGEKVFSTPVGKPVNNTVLQDFNEFGREAEYLSGRVPAGLRYLPIVPGCRTYQNLHRMQTVYEHSGRVAKWQNWRDLPLSPLRLAAQFDEDRCMPTGYAHFAG